LGLQLLRVMSELHLDARFAEVQIAILHRFHIFAVVTAARAGKLVLAPNLIFNQKVARLILVHILI